MNPTRQHRQKTKDSNLEVTQQNALNVLRQPGQPLDSDVRELLEPRFGHSFADVRVHHDTQAAKAAEAFDARAFAVGQNIVLNDGEYDPDSPQGLELLAHELTHTIQQRGARDDAPLEINERSSHAEVEARGARDRVMHGEQAGSVSSSSELSVAREDEPRWGAAAPVIDPLTNDGLGLIPGMLGGFGTMSEQAIRAAYPFADDAEALIRAGVTAGPGVGGLSRTASALAPFAGIANRVSQVAAPFSAIGGALDMGTDIGRLYNGTGSTLENAGNLAAHSASTFSAGVTTAGAAGELLGALGLGGEGLVAATAGGTALGTAGALAGSFAGGYTVGTALNEHTTIGNYTSDYIGMASEVFGGGDRNWLLNQTESAENNWNQGNYGSAALDGLQIAGTTALGTLGGATAWAGNGIADGARALWDLL
jgi:hypothetical protein